MAIPGTTSALIAAFAFGIVVNAASAALFLSVRGHGSSLFRDGKRLVLVLFFLSAALWGQIDFITILIDPTATQSCQVGVIFTTIFDQLARYLIEQHLLWVINDGAPSSTPQYIVQGILAGRLILGGAFVGLSKPELDTVCAPISSIPIVGIVVIAVDAVIILALAARASAAGSFSKMQNGGQDGARGKAVIAVLVGMAIWTATSAAMLLGSATTDYLLRSALPAGGLALLLTIVTGLSNSLVAPERRIQGRQIPEAPSPRMITTARSISTSASNDYPPSRYEDLKTEQIRSSTAFIQPREVPMPGQPQRTSQGQTLPNITNAVMGGQGVGGVPVQGQLFPPLRANADALPLRPQLARDNSKKSFFDTFDPAKAPARAVTVGKLAISNPVLQEGGSNPLDKVATMDLATAAQLEKDRRALMAMQAQPVPVGQIDSDATPERGLERATTTIRKDIAEPVEPSQLESTSATTGFATGAQLSPAGDELRRRSPRQATSDNADKQPTKLSALSVETSRTPSPPPKSAARALPVQSTYGASAIIRPSRQRPPSPEPLIEPVKTPLQRRPTNGLPGNPRALSVKKRSPPEGLNGRQETVMFVNNIVYDDPNFVANVMEEAKGRGPRPTPALITTTVITATDGLPLVLEAPHTAASIVHRPRPIPRKNLEEGEGSFYPPAGHQRSKSAGNVVQRRQILQSNPGSPTTLPPLPPPPQPSANNARPQPNNTKSMTFDEKVNYLFPHPRGAQRPERRSSVPDVVGSFMNDSPTLTEFDDQDAGFRDSKKSMASVRTRSIFSDQDRGQQREVSLAAYQGLIDESEERSQGESPTDGTWRTNGAKRASSPVLPIFGDIRSASITSHDNDIATNLGSVYSPLPVQQVGLAVHQARAIEVVRLDKPLDARAVSAVTNSEEMTIMLDTSVAREVHQGQVEDDPSSPIDDGSPVEERTSTRSSGPWHRRVGDETLSFSMLSDKRNSRRGPPPIPLSLSSRPTQAKQVALAQAAEPSPLPSPEEALQMIQNQLKKYEQADRLSTQSPGRLALLNDLEMEMGQQETRWLGMQHEFSRDSLSTLDMNSPTAGSRRTSAVAAASLEDSLSRNSSMRSNLSEDRRASRRTRLVSIVSTGSLALDGDDLPLGSRASLWQKKLAAAQLKYMEHELDRKRSINFLSMSYNLGSPSPPDSEETEIGIESRRDFEALLAARNKQIMPGPKAELWTAPQLPEDRSGLMWIRPEKPYHVNLVEPPLPGLSVRLAQRKDISELSIDMGQLLWVKPATTSMHSYGLWRSSTEVHEAEEAQTTPESRTSKFYKSGLQSSRTVPSSRPLTQRPPRRSRRITALPDILEDPQPLPDKRDTLGIFQFPWGEKSDIPSVPIRPSFMAMPGTMSTGGGSNVRLAQDVRSRQLEESEYSSSFFDDYDDDDEDGKSDDSSEMGSDSDDGFDETTLFEIASLLQASRNDMPSTNSIFGPSRDPVDSVLDDYGFEPEQSDEDVRQTILLGIEEEIKDLQEISSPMPSRPESLWATPEIAGRGAHGKGLPQPEDWHTHDETTQSIRAKPRILEHSASVASDNLWVLAPLETNTSKSPMWTPSESLMPSSSGSESARPEPTSSVEYSELSTPASSQAFIGGPLLWQAKEQLQKGDHGVGLPHPQNWESYDHVKVTIRAKPRQSEPVVIESFNLWAIPTPEPPSMPSFMWAPTVEPAPVAQIPSPIRRVVNQAKPSSRLLWSAPAPPTRTVDSALFNPNSGRTDFKTTSQAPAALQMEQKSRSPLRKPINRLTSSALWASAAPAKAGTDWLSLKSSPKNLLWSEPPPKKDTTFGLYDPRSGRSDFRSTSQAPAAIEIIRKARSSEKEPLQQLVSNNLWTVKTAAGPARNWIKSSRSSKLVTLKSTLLPETRKASLRQAIAFSLLRVEPVPIELWNDGLDQALTASSSGNSAEAAASSTGRDVALQAAISLSLLRVEAVPVQRWQESLDKAVAASYPASQSATGEASAKSDPEDKAVSLVEAVAQRSEEIFDVTKRHPVFAASSLTSTASMIHPAATGYTADVAAVHPVYFGSGTGVFAHPAMPSKTSKIIRAFNVAAHASSIFGPGGTAAPEEAPRSMLTRQGTQRGRVSRISAMVSMFEDPTRSRSASRGESVEPETRLLIAPTRPAAPEPPVQKEDVTSDQERETDPETLVRLDALDQERMFTEQWATGSFEAGLDVAVDKRGPLAPEPVLLPATQYDPAIPAQQQLSLADQLEADLFTPNTLEVPMAPWAPEFRAKEDSLTIATQARSMTANELAVELLTPEATTPVDQLASAGTSKREKYESKGWMLPPAVRASQRGSQLSRSDTVKSAVSALSETDSERITLRDSLVSVDSERGRSPDGSQARFI